MSFPLSYVQHTQTRGVLATFFSKCSQLPLLVYAVQTYPYLHLLSLLLAWNIPIYLNLVFYIRKGLNNRNPEYMINNHIKGNNHLIGKNPTCNTAPFFFNTTCTCLKGLLWWFFKKSLHLPAILPSHNTYRYTTTQSVWVATEIIKNIVSNCLPLQNKHFCFQVECLIKIST